MMIRQNESVIESPKSAGWCSISA